MAFQAGNVEPDPIMTYTAGRPDSERGAVKVIIGSSL